MMSDDEDCCTPISYVYGGISVSPKPPGHFTLGVRVVVGTQVAPLTGPDLGHDHAIWHYLVAVRPGPTKVVCSLGDITSSKSVETRSGETSIVNFCFGKPVVSSNAKVLPKMKAKRRQAERLLASVPTTGNKLEAAPKSGTL